MKATQTCPKCSGKKFAVTREFRVPAYRSMDVLPPVTIDNGGTPKRLGTFEAWSCLACGYTEFYACGLVGVDEIARAWPEQVRIVDATPPERGPYR